MRDIGSSPEGSEQHYAASCQKHCSINGHAGRTRAFPPQGEMGPVCLLPGGFYDRHGTAFGPPHWGSLPKHLQTKPKSPPPCISKPHAWLPAATCQLPVPCCHTGSAAHPTHPHASPEACAAGTAWAPQASGARKGTGGYQIRGEELWGGAGGCHFQRSCLVNRRWANNPSWLLSRSDLG